MGRGIAQGNAYTVELSHGPNPDLDKGYWDPPVDSGRPRRVSIASVGEASKVVREYIERNNLGGGNFREAPIRNALGVEVARVSYNGRIWLPGDWPTQEHPESPGYHLDEDEDQGVLRSISISVKRFESDNDKGITI
jgi:hypothetical protein